MANFMQLAHVLCAHPGSGAYHLAAHDQASESDEDR